MKYAQTSSRSLVRLVWPVLALACLAAPALAYEAAPRQNIDLSGTWRLDRAASDDPEELLMRRLQKERDRYERWRRQHESRRITDTGVESAREPARRSGPRPWQKRHMENLHKMLGISDSLVIRQSGASFELITAVESRRVEAGTHTQVSMPEGQLADSEAGWSGRWFVIERRVRGGPRVVEKFRLLGDTGQLEYRMAWSGDSELAGIKVRRLYHRASGELPPRDPAAGPVR